MPAPLNYTTQIATGKTVGEIQKLLADHGAQRIAVDYDGGAARGLSFSIGTPHGPRLFTLPVNVDAMHALLIRKDRAGQLKSGSRATRTSLAQAERVAWRITKDWIAAQLAMVESAMVSLDQVMLPYLHVTPEVTLYESYRQHELSIMQRTEIEQ